MRKWRVLGVTIYSSSRGVYGLLRGCVGSSYEVLRVRTRARDFVSKGILGQGLQRKRGCRVCFLSVRLTSSAKVDMDSYVEGRVGSRTTRVMCMSKGSKCSHRLFTFEPFGFVRGPFSRGVIATALRGCGEVCKGGGSVFRCGCNRSVCYTHIDRVLCFGDGKEGMGVMVRGSRSRFCNSLRRIYSGLGKRKVVLARGSCLIGCHCVESFRKRRIVVMGNSMVPITENEGRRVTEVRLRFRGKKFTRNV